MDKKELILDFISSDFDKAKMKKIIQNSLLKLNDPVKVSAQLPKILDGDMDILKDNEVNEIYKNIENINFNKSDTINSPIDVKEDIVEQTYRISIEETQVLNNEMKKKDEEIRKLKLELIKEREVRSKLENIIYLTKKQSLSISSDDDINELYLKHLASGEDQHQTAIVAKNKNTVIIPKTYYVIK